jgi:peptidoglycan/xylan/chitin deacetylase (PgdA/CDA1 family)
MRSAEMLEGQGWRGHYFIPSSCIGAPGFLTAGELRALQERGHTVGSHSHSHPLQMGRLSRDAVRDEWARSIAILQDVLGTVADVASVPGGYYRPFIAETAAACGVRWLFSSEPVVRVERVAEAWVLGRYTLRRGARAEYVQALTRTPSLARAMQWTTWNMKKAAKRVAGDRYLRVRSALFREAPPQTGDRRPGS